MSRTLAQCPNCRGDGVDLHNEKCSACSGNGRVLLCPCCSGDDIHSLEAIFGSLRERCFQCRECKCSAPIRAWNRRGLPWRKASEELPGPETICLVQGGGDWNHAIAWRRARREGWFDGWEPEDQCPVYVTHWIPIEDFPTPEEDS